MKSPKVFIRDSGLLHHLLNISTFDDLLGHPVAGASWEGFVIENILNRLPDTWKYSYYRTADLTEIDLILEGPQKQRRAIEIKRSAAPTLTKGFFNGCKDIEATHKFVVYSGTEHFPMPESTEAVGVVDFVSNWLA